MFIFTLHIAIFICACSVSVRIDEKESQRKALDAFLGKGNSVMERMQLTGLQGDPSGLEVQNAIFKQFQAIVLCCKALKHKMYCLESQLLTMIIQYSI